MMRLAIMLALAVGALAGGCFLQEDYTCVKKNAVKCGGDWCHGHCDVSHKKSCDTKVWFKTVCDKEDYCKKIETPCGDDAADYAGLTCGSGEECVADQKCKLIPAHKKKSFAGWHSRSMPGGFFEVCKDVYSCAPVDPWGLDFDAIEVVCTKEYEIVEDMDCGFLWGEKRIWGGIAISQDKFFKLNHGFSCDKKLVGRVICVEAEAKIKAEYCNDSYCDSGYECATKEICSEVAVEKPVCARKPHYTCLNHGSSGASICGNRVCGHHEKCEIISKTVCPQVVPVPVPGPIVVPVPVPTPTPNPIPVPTPVPNPTPTPTVTPSASSVSASLADDIGTATSTDAVVAGDAEATANGYATKGDETFSSSDSQAEQGVAITATDVNAAEGDEAVADAGAASN